MLLIVRLGWPGIFCPLIVVLVAPLQGLIGKMNAGTLRRINKEKDERIKLITEVVEGIHFLKLYSWEMPFKRIIQAIRQKEISSYIKLGLGKSIERSLPVSIFPFSCFVSFVVIHFTPPGPAAEHFSHFLSVGNRELPPVLHAVLWLGCGLLLRTQSHL